VGLIGRLMGEGALSADIEFLCVASHERRDVGAVTIVERRWAYCGEGAAGEHDWRQIKPTPMGALAGMGPSARQELLTELGGGPQGRRGSGPTA
jgi:hypothetical protein